MLHNNSTYITLARNYVATPCFIGGDKSSHYFGQSYDQLEILFSWKKEKMDMGKELESCTIYSYIARSKISG